MITKNIYVKGKRYIAIWEMHLSWRSTSAWCRLIFLSEDFNLGATLPFLSSYIVTIIFWFISDFHYNGFIVTILTDQPNIYTYYMKVNQVRNNAISIITFPFFNVCGNNLNILFASWYYFYYFVQWHLNKPRIPNDTDNGQSRETGNKTKKTKQKHNTMRWTPLYVTKHE